MPVGAAVAQPQHRLAQRVGDVLARRLRRQLLVEHLLLAATGAAVAAGIAVPMHRLLVEQRILALPRTTTGKLRKADLK